MFERFRGKEEVVEPKTYRKKSSRKSPIERSNQVLAYLSTVGDRPVTLSEVGSAIGLDNSSVSRILGRLLDSRAISRAKAPKRRFVYTVKRSRVNNKRKAVNIKPKQARTRTKHGESKGKVLNFITAHENQLISQREISQGTGVAVSNVSRLVNLLESEGAIVRSDTTYNGTRYWVNGGPNTDIVNGVPMEPTAPPEPQPPKQDTLKLLAEHLDPLVWRFIKETSSNDVVLFLHYVANHGEVLTREE